MKKIVTHNGGAHRDDFLACCVAAIVTDNCPIYRVAKPTQEDLDDPEVLVLDFGTRFEPELHNFDHHQMKGGEQCAFTLFMDSLGWRDYNALPWIKYVEVWDHCGPQKAIDLVGKRGGDYNLVFSPVESYFIEQFSLIDGLVPQDFREVLKLLGKHIVSLITRYRESRAHIEEKAKILEVHGFRVVDYQSCDPEKIHFLAGQKFEEENKIDIILNNNLRDTQKHRMIRKGNVDFNCAKGIDGVGFVHQNGFLICFDGDFEPILEACRDEQ